MLPQMASFSRGLPPQWHLLILRQTQQASCKCTPPSPLQTNRFFTTSLRLLKKFKTKTKTNTKTTPSPTTPSSTTKPLLSKPRFDGLSWWVPQAYGVICVAMAAMATYFILGTNRIIKTISAVSSTSSSLTKSSARPSGQGPLYIEVTTQRMFPFMKPKKKLYMPHEVELPFRMGSLFEHNKRLGKTETLSVAEQVKQQRAEIEAKKKEREYTMNHLLTAPFRDAKKVFKGAWPGIVRSFSREGFTKISIGGEIFKLDTSGGWALDDGRAMDRLLPIRPYSVDNTTKLL
ncbi:hypothetical protein B0T21DRAFT_357085 [Apiosordaria backusii]|uniref:Uncharacterized protein n=1 Tax=Apiosordaria backusii TaxID=314023 RepID=A0AA40K7E6_9PEZI|nr:hypothetical protein B0T21DRAFT_357085 [Apiosordaria backusii]